MKYTLILSGFVLVGGAVFLLTSCRNKTQKIDSRINYSQKDTNPKKNYSENSYDDLRRQAFSITPKLLGVKNSDDTDIFGVIMDWDIGNGVMTLVTYKTGDASMYLSTGGGVIGGGQHEKVRKKSIQFVAMSDEYLNKSVKTVSTPGPDKDCVRFYFLTSSGIFTIQEQMKNFENQTSPFLSYFEEANKVIYELRSITNE